jgi:hypothetical protein
MAKIKGFFLVILMGFLGFPVYSQTGDLYQEIVALDSILFNAYNNCDISKQADLYSDSIEFYHDKGGLSTSKEDILESIRKNVCGKVTRELVPGSIEVSPIPGYGAVELGMHMFHNNQEKDQVPHPSRFVIIWKITNNKWTITRIISLH